MNTTSNQHSPDNHQNDAVISYYQLRMFIGLLGFFLSFMLFLTTFLLNDTHPFKVSISHYYYSYGHVIFVGTLCIMGGLLGTYRGKVDKENLTSNICGILAVLVAAFPTRFCGYEGDAYIQFTGVNYKCWFMSVHYASAALLFILFAVFCLKFFQYSDKELEGEKLLPEEKVKKKRRNAYYTFCGYGILISIACIGAIAVFENANNTCEASSNLFLKYSTLIFETTSLFFFSTSWLLKSSDSWNHNIPLIRFFR